MSESLAATNWDTAYGELDKYKDAPPVAFVEKIVENLGQEDKDGLGLYIGCGNGRNFIPLADAGLAGLRGLDISSVGIDQITARRPDLASRLLVGNFANFRHARIFDYIIAIQVFQHGVEETAQGYFRLAASALKPQGKLFLRVNSVNTEIVEDHDEIEHNNAGGLTVKYLSGEKIGQPIHFFSRKELRQIARRNNFVTVQPIREVFEERPGGKTGSWAQWEAIWQKK